MKCPNCGTRIDHDDYFCPECGGEFKEYKKEGKTTGFATASFILGLLGLILFFIPLLSFLAILFGIIAFVKIGSNKNLQGRGLAIAGLVMGVVKWVFIIIAIKTLPKMLGPIIPAILGVRL